MFKKKQIKKNVTFSELISEFSALAQIRITISVNSSLKSTKNYEFKQLSVIDSLIAQISNKFKEIYQNEGPFEEIWNEFASLKSSLIKTISDQKSYSDDYISDSEQSSIFYVLNQVSSFVSKAVVKINKCRNFSLEQNKDNLTDNVFIVHGGEQSYIDKIKKTIKKCNHNSIIMEEQNNNGSEFALEKFIGTTNDCGLCVVLLINKGVSEEIRFKSNPLIELGYFLKKVGRNRIFIITDVTERQLPSDINGAMVIKTSDRHWLTQLENGISNIYK